MAIITRLRHRFARKAKAPVDIVPQISTFFGPGTLFQPDHRTLLRENIGIPAAATRAIANRVSSLVPQVYITRRMDRTTTEDEIFDDHPLLTTLEHPHPNFSLAQLLRLTSQYIVTVGEAYWMKVESKMGIPVELHIVPPQMVTPVVKSNVVQTYSVVDANGALKSYPAQDFVRFYFPDTQNPWRSEGYLAPSGITADTHKFTGQHLRSHYQNDATPKTLLEAGEGAESWTKEELEVFYERWKDFYNSRGGSRTGLPAMTPIGYKLIEFAMQSGIELAPLLEHLQDELLLSYGVPKSVLGQVVSGDRSSAECLSADTECLTREGWKTHDQLSMQDEIATWNPRLERLEYQRSCAPIYRKPYRGEMHHWKTRRIDFLATPDHRMFVQLSGLHRNGEPKHWGIRRSWELAELSVGQKWRMTGGNCPDACEQWVEIDFMPRVQRGRGGFEQEGDRSIDFRLPSLKFDATDFAEFLGYWISEGSAADHGHELRLHQNPGSVLDAMRGVLSRLGFGRIRESVGVGRHCVSLIFNEPSLKRWLVEKVGRTCKEKRLPRCVYAWTPQAQRILLEAMIDGDGHRDAKGQSCTYYSTASRALADDVQHLAVQLGLRASIGGLDAKGGYRVFLTEKQFGWLSTYTPKQGWGADRKEPVLQKVAYDGIVWCVTVPNHIFFTRRNGKVACHGNTNQWVFDRYAVYPVAKLIEDSITYQLAPDFDSKLKFRFEPFVSEDKALVLKQEQQDLELKVRSVNQVRKDRNLKPVAWGELPVGQMQDTPYTATDRELPKEEEGEPPEGSEQDVMEDADEERAERKAHIAVRQHFKGRRERRRKRDGDELRVQ